MSGKTEAIVRYAIDQLTPGQKCIFVLAECEIRLSMRLDGQVEVTYAEYPELEPDSGADTALEYLLDNPSFT